MTVPTATTRDRLRPAAWAALAVGAAGAATALAGAAVSLGVAVTRVGADVAGVACVGLALVAVLLPGPTGATRRDLARIDTRVDRALLVLGGAWVVLVLLGVTLRSADAFGRTLGQLGGGEVVAWSTRLAAGRGMVLTAGCALVVLVCAVVRLRDPDRIAVRIPLIAALLGVLTPTVTGHAGSAPDHQLAVVTAALHAGAAALWVGGLGALLVLVAAHRPLLDATIGRFSQLAGLCVVIVAITGVLGAQVRLENWGALLTTGYGLLVVAKGVALVALGGLGWLARRRLAAGRTPVLRWAGIEVALMAVTLGLAAALTQTPP
ncbi:copper resistance D family protein [Pseudonocardia abyssalis]|uniref:CopD family protein n=1 Tax=Pseudonocardia abyssalis TaxID=2792008 RepID=A0ABS6UY38_9PSEU|nr:CopD family protein [Pseudonocardia abyssalis]MBW0117045.1 CopD family protein [Pseudonocardia abyssalis]MBW0137176.1 CopD family protein [Pseudonocardia abyssalis]